MANWVELLNLYVNYETKNKVSELASQQAEISSTFRSTHNIQAIDNSYLSKLVDIYVEVKNLIIQQKYFDALIAGSYGLSLCDEFYKSMINVDYKLKASELKFQILETIIKILQDKNIISKIEDSFTVTINEISSKIDFIKKEINTIEFYCESVKSDYSDLKSGQFLVKNNTDSDITISDMALINELNIGNGLTSIKLQFLNEKHYLIYKLKTGDIFEFMKVQPSYEYVYFTRKAFFRMKKIFEDEYLDEQLNMSKSIMININENMMKSCNTTINDVYNKIEECWHLLYSKMLNDLNAYDAEKEMEKGLVNNTILKLLFVAVIIIIIYFLFR